MDSTRLSRIRFDKTVAKAQVGNYEYVKEQVGRWGVLLKQRKFENTYHDGARLGESRWNTS
jgi:hypothetical protein